MTMTRERKRATPFHSGPPEIVELLMNLSAIHYGDDALIRDIGVCLVARGPIAVQGVPGTGKSRLGRAVANMVKGTAAFKQLHPEDNPSDLLGYERLVNFATGERELVYGPIFADVVILDEINRGRESTVNALLEALQERWVRLGNFAKPLPLHQFIMTTFNPLHEAGTREIGAALKDRHMMMCFPNVASDPTEMDKVLNAALLMDVEDLGPVMDVKELEMHQERCLKLAKSIHAKHRAYVAEVVTALNPEGDNATVEVADCVRLGPSARAGKKWIEAAAGLAYITGSPSIEPHHLSDTAVQSLRHRIELRPQKRHEVRGQSLNGESEYIDLLINDTLASVATSHVAFMPKHDN